MAEFKTPKRIRSVMTNNVEFHTPIKIPPSPFLKQIGYGCGKHFYIAIYFEN